MQTDLKTLIHHALEYAARHSAHLRDAGVHPGDLEGLAEILTRLATALHSGGQEEIIEVQEVKEDDAPATSNDTTSARNLALASALGACDCWGEDARCPVCHGKGRPGWTLPEKPFFDYYVRPAVTHSASLMPAGAPNRRTRSSNQKKSEQTKEKNEV